MKTQSKTSMLLLLLGITLISFGCGKATPVEAPATSSAAFPANLEFEQPEALK